MACNIVIESLDEWNKLISAHPVCCFNVSENVIVRSFNGKAFMRPEVILYLDFMFGFL